MLRHFEENYNDCDSQGEGGNLTELQKDYHRQWLRSSPFQLARNGRYHASVIGFRSSIGEHAAELLRPNHPIVRLTDVEMLSYVPIPQELAELRPGAPRRNNYCEVYEIRRAFIDNGDVWFSNRLATFRKVVQCDGSLPPRQDHLACINKYYGHKPGAGLGDQIEEARAENESTENAIIAPLSGKFTVKVDELWYRLCINGKSVFRVLRKDKDAFVYTSDGRENPELIACQQKGRVAKGEVITRLSAPVEYLAAVIEDDSTKPIYIGGSTPAASRNDDRLQFIVDAKRGIIDYSIDVAVRHVVPKAAEIDFEDRFPRLLLELPVEDIRDRRDNGWVANDDFRKMLRRAVNEGRLEESLFGLPAERQYATYAELAEAAGTHLMHLEDTYFDSLIIKPGMQGWIGEGWCVDSRIAGESLRGLAQDPKTPRWLDFSKMTDYYVGKFKESAVEGVPGDFVSGLYFCPPMSLDLTKGLTRRVKDVVYDFQPSGDKFAKMGQRLSRRAQAAQPREANPAPRRRRRAKRSAR